MGTVGNSIRSFYKTEIQKNYKFLVDIHCNDVNLGLKSHLVKDVTFPRYSFGKEMQKVGHLGKIYPIFNFEGLELKLTLKEDTSHSSALFIEQLFARQMTNNGMIVNPKKAYIDTITVSLYDDSNDQMTAQYCFKECFLMNVTETNLDYTQSDGVIYTLTLACNYYNLNVELPNDSSAPAPGVPLDNSIYLKYLSKPY